MQIRKNLILAVLILGFSLVTGLSADRKHNRTNDPAGLRTGEKSQGKRSGPVAPEVKYFFAYGNNYIYWLSEDIIYDFKKMDLKKNQSRRVTRSGNVKQMFSIMHL